MMRNRSASWLLGALLLAAPAVGLLAEEEGDADTAKQKAACEAAIKEDDARDEQKLTEAYRAKCKALTVEASRLKPVENKSSGDDADETETASTKKSGNDFPPMQGNDLTPEQDAAAQEAGERIQQQADKDARLMEWAKKKEAEWATMTPEERKNDIDNLRRTVGGQAKMGRVQQLLEAEGQILQSAQGARYANEAAAARDYAEIGRPNETLTPEQQIGRDTLANMAGAHAGRVARESGFMDDATKQALRDDPTFASAFEASKKETPPDGGVGAYPGQHPEAEPRRLADNHTFGECNKPVGNVPALPCGTITSGFGYRSIAWSPYHYGLDTRAPEGAAIMGSAIGRVADVKYEGPGRVSVHVDHGNGFVTIHRHVDAESALPKGSQVTTQTQIGAVATAGTGPHKHTEVWFEGRALNINNYNQVAYTDRCTVGCGEVPLQQPNIAQDTRPINNGVQGPNMRTVANGNDPATTYNGGVRTGSTALAAGGNLAPAGFAPIYRNNAQGGSYNTFDLGNRDVGDGGMYDTAPNFQGMRMPSGQQGGVSTANTPLNPYGGLFNPDLFKQFAVNTLTSQTTVPLVPTPETPTNTRLTPEQCQEKMNQGERALDLLRNHPECSLLTK